MNRVLVVGDLVDDISVRVLDEVTEASDTNAEIRMRPGGSAGNVAAWLGHLGVDTVFCGRVGADAIERHTIALADHGVVAHLAGDPDRTTATIVLQLDHAGERTMFVDRGANSGLVLADVPDAAWDGVTWLHLTGYTFFDPATRPVATGLVEEARRRGLPVSVDPSSLAFLRTAGAEAFLTWTAGAEVVLPNLDEARLLIGSTGPAVDLDALAARFPHVVVTLGPLGAAYLGGTHRAQVTAPRVEVVDTTGAGDAFAAGFLARWITGATAEDALDGGRAAAESCVAHLGARPVVG